MICAMTVRQLKPGAYEDFRRAVVPDPWLPKLDRVMLYRNEDSPDQVLSIGCFDVTAEEYEALRDDPDWIREEDARLHRVSELQEHVLVNGLFELTDDLRPPA